MLKTDSLHVLLAHCDEPIPEAFWDYAKPTQSLASLSSKHIQKWKSRRLAHFLLHQLFEQNGLDRSLLHAIVKTPSGRPFVRHSQVDFNISHSGEWVAVIFSYNTPKKVVGIDIEHPQKIRRYTALLNHFATAQEMADIHNPAILPQLPTLAQRFYLSWCLREAVLKSQGVGIAKLLEVQHFPHRQQIFSPHCPRGQLVFYSQLPCYLAYFCEQTTLATLSEWKNGQCHPICTAPPIIYQVNP